MSSASHEPTSRPWLIIAALALVLALVVFWLGLLIASARDAAQPARTLEPPLVEVTEARAAPSLYHIVEEGFLRARAQIDVVPEISGKVVEVAEQLEPGGRFAAGELLFRIDARTFEAQLAQAQADVAAARSEVSRADAERKRQSNLEGIGAAAKSRREQANASFAAARARLGQAEASLIAAQKRLEDTAITAPFDAAVIRETIALGMFLQPGLSAATIYDTSAGEVVVGLLPGHAQAVRRAMQSSEGPLTVAITPSRGSASRASLQGIVKRFGAAVDSSSRTIPVIIEVPDAFADGAEVYANDFVSVQLLAAAQEALFVIPNGALREERYVWSLTDTNQLHAVAVTRLERKDDETIIQASEDLTGVLVMTTALTEESEGLEVEVAPSTRNAAIAVPRESAP